jgi:hypothetical protein
MSTHRLPCSSFTESVSWVADHFKVDRRIATLLIWEVAFRIGTDRHYWIDQNQAQRFIASNAPIAV